ncbi:MAG: DNA gyrase inhibitor YacG [Planctomycetota bacterium]|nr:MAG: DNA gyrase inhibitor YacG [Planctomycetota bacterium]
MSEPTAPLPCPLCGEPGAPPGRPAFPFCSLRCKAQDMYHWLDGTYERRLAGEELEEDDGGEDEL